MQPPSEADVVAVTESLKRQKLAIDNQIRALNTIADALLENGLHIAGLPAELEEAIGELALSFSHQRFEDSQALGSAIAHSERVLQAYRSGIILPTHIQRKPTN